MTEEMIHNAFFLSPVDEGRASGTGKSRGSGGPKGGAFVVTSVGEKTCSLDPMMHQDTFLRYLQSYLVIKNNNNLRLRV